MLQEFKEAMPLGYTMFGFPLDLTNATKEQGVTVDIDGFNKCLTNQQESTNAASFDSSINTKSMVKPEMFTL